MEKKCNQKKKKKKEGKKERNPDSFGGLAWTRAQSGSDIIAKNYRRICERFE